MKIAINKCYGGFNLSPKGLEAYAAKKGIEKLYWFDIKHDLRSNVELVPVNDPSDALFNIAYDVPNPDNDTKSFSGRDISRDDPDLISVIEELGSKIVSSRLSELAVVEIPDDVKWTIEEYDGVEWVSEVHRTWR